MFRQLLFAISASFVLLDGVLAQSNIDQQIPFQLTESNNISIAAKINKTNAVDLMFHTANHSVCLTKTAVAKMTDLSMDQSSSVKSWGGDSSARFSENNVLQIGERTWDDFWITEDDHSGPGTDGKFGWELFEDQVIALDFDKSLLTVYSTLPTLDDTYQKLELDIRGSLMFVKGAISIGNEQLEHKFLIHSGYSGALLLDDEFVSKHEIGSKLPTISESQLTDSFGNVLKTKKINVPSFQLGSVNFTNVPVGIFDGAISRQKMSVMGGDLLKRFNIVINFKDAHIYLQPNSLVKAKFKA